MGVILDEENRDHEDQMNASTQGPTVFLRKRKTKVDIPFPKSVCVQDQITDFEGNSDFMLSFDNNYKNRF